MLEKHYFCAANTPKGFYSCFNNVIDTEKAERIVYIKGGSGTGKSTLMRRLADTMIKDGFETEMFHCSSDPKSLDGVHIPLKKVAIFDGTAPHSMDPIYPGAVDEIINLGECWNEEILKENRDEIILYCKNKKNEYANVYRHLAAAGKLLNIKKADELTVQSCAEDLISRFKLRLFAQSPGKIRKLFVSGITPLGIVNYWDSIFEGYVIGLMDCAESSELLKIISHYAALSGLNNDAFFCPLSPDDKLEHLYIPKLDLAFTTLNDYHWYTNCDQIIELSQYEEQSDLKDNVENAVKALRNAKEWHDKIEEIYIPAMDFDKVNKLWNNLMDKIL